jgi:hypothetical protein
MAQQLGDTASDLSALAVEGRSNLTNGSATRGVSFDSKAARCVATL